MGLSQLFGDHSGDTVSASPGQAPDVAAACGPPVLPGEASWDFCSRQARGILAPQPWIEPASHALEDTGLITGPPGKSHQYNFDIFKKEGHLEWELLDSLPAWNDLPPADPTLSFRLRKHQCKLL
ncbi:PREDICTED: uncharacterized protein LOC104992877 isoform X3 [Bison bison bison]|uniref:Uncharacterized protein LOC104992877 isoform X3 n=1 Tax=Bison bison bison TaxID=43346 RepID=A0A6P3I082_BISBB|nr:PREDICTED: uncharacterized protein LOC104992877 isoform X3 [Bison bison bison]